MRGGGLPQAADEEAVRLHPYVQASALLATAALVMLWLGEYTDLDLWLADRFYDAGLHAFPWRHHWFAETLIHRWLKQGIVLAGVTLMALVVIDAFQPLRHISAVLRIRLRMLAWSALLVPLSISQLKQLSALSCPWDIDRYGGDAPYLRLFDAVPPGLSAGHCFPAGFASTGLWLAACAVFWLPHQPKKAGYVFAGGLGFGVLLGLVQQARGAHFLTHTLWSAWIASTLLLAIYAAHARQLNSLHQ